jgi:hypothetical protein
MIRSEQPNVWPAPSARVNIVRLWSVCINVSGLGSCPRPRWRSAQSDPHNHIGLGGRFGFSGSQAAVRLSGHLPCAARRLREPIGVADRRRQAIASGRRYASGLIGAAARQHRPGDARQLVGQCDDVLVRPCQRSARPSAKRRLAIDQVRRQRVRSIPLSAISPNPAMLWTRRRPGAARRSCTTTRGTIVESAGRDEEEICPGRTEKRS